MQRIPGVLAVLASAALLWPAAQATRASASTASTSITVNGARSGPAFQGVGAISGGGGNSRLLIDYPEPERSQILDYLFKPDYGAALQSLKLEIGGDANSTDGAEPSVEHAAGQINCDSGYEWWLAEQARARDPEIKLYGLQWAAPGWAAAGGSTIWTPADVGYVIDWLNCAASHGLTINYLGGWNERGWSTTWYADLRQALDSNGYAGVQLVAADNAAGSPQGAGTNTAATTSESLSPGAVPLYNAASAWAVAAAMKSDPAFAAAVGVVGAHDTCEYPTTGDPCEATATARGLGRPVWATELGAMDANTGAADMARAINNGYNQAGMTGFLEWPLIDSMPPGLPYENRGLVTADQPWSGNYTVDRMTWAIAQTTQFVGPGWRHVGGANRPLAGGGSYDTYQAPDGSAWSMVAETANAPGKPAIAKTQHISVRIKGGLPAGTVHVWRTNLWSARPGRWFVRRADIRPSRGRFSYTLPRGYLYTFSTTTGQSKGTAHGPASRAMTLPYTDPLTVATAPEGDEPALLSAQDGAFEYAPCTPDTGQCVQQAAAGAPVYWTRHAGHPYAVIGGSWRDYSVSADVRFTQDGSAAGVIGRFSARANSAIQQFDGYEFEAAASGSWSLARNRAASGPVTLASGTVTALGTGTWHTLTLGMTGAALTASIDGTTVASVTNSSDTSGAAGLMTGGYYDVQFRNLAISP